MELQYLYGNPRRPKLSVRKKAVKTRRSAKNPVIFSNNPLSKAQIAKLRAEFAKESKKPAKKAVARKPISDEARLAKNKKNRELSAKLKTFFKKFDESLAKGKPKKKKLSTKSHQGEGNMTKKKAKKVAKKATAKKKVHAKKAKTTKKKVAKKASKKVAKKVHAKKKPVAKKATAKKARKSARRSRKAKKVFKTVGGSVKRRGKKLVRRDSHKKYVAGKNTRVSDRARKLKKGQEMSEVVHYAPKRRKNKKTGKVSLGKVKIVKVTAKALNPRKKRKSKRSMKRRNPLVMSNPRFMKNPMGNIGSKIVNLENKIIGNSGFKSVDGMARKFLNAGVLEIAGLAVGAGFDGEIVNLVKKIPKSELVLAHIPAGYQGSAITGATGLALHLVNSFLAKKSGKKSQILDELSKGLIASALVKAVAHASKYSQENAGASTPTDGFVMDRSMSGLIMSNPSSMHTGNSDFSGADFEGADYGTSSIGGADFEGYGGYVSSMGNVENAMDADEAMSEAEDYGSDVASMSGKW